MGEVHNKPGNPKQLSTEGKSHIPARATTARSLPVGGVRPPNSHVKGRKFAFDELSGTPRMRSGATVVRSGQLTRFERCLTERLVQSVSGWSWGGTSLLLYPSTQNILSFRKTPWAGLGANIKPHPSVPLNKQGSFTN